MRSSAALAALLTLAVPAVVAAQPGPAPGAAKPLAGAAPAAPKPPAPGAAAPAAPQGATSGVPAGQAPGTPAKIEINDPDLAPIPPAAHVIASWQDAVAMMNSRSTDVLVAQQEIERAQNLSDQALALALPLISASGSLSFGMTRAAITGTVADPTDPTGARTIDVNAGSTTRSALASTSVQAVQPILALRTWHAIDTAKLSIKSSRMSYEDKRRTTVAAVAAAIVNVVTAERVAEINRIGLRSSLELLELTERKAKLGSGTLLDVVRAKQDTTVARATLVNGDEAVRKAREALGLLLGSSEAWGVPPTISLNDIESTLKRVCSPAAPDQRSDVLAAKIDRQVAERQTAEAKLAYLPTTNATLQGNALLQDSHVDSSAAATAAGGGGNLASPRSFGWSIAATLTVPIWDGGTRDAAVRISKINEREASLKVDATTRQASLDATQSVRAVQVADQARAISVQGRDLAAQTARLSQIAFEAGTGTSFDLVNSAKTAREAEADLAVKELGVVQAKIAALLAASSCTY